MINNEEYYKQLTKSLGKTQPYSFKGKSTSTDIVMIPFDCFKVIPRNGKYLVKTESLYMHSIHFLEATCTIVWNEKKKCHMTSVDVNNQTVKEISKKPL